METKRKRNKVAKGMAKPGILAKGADGCVIPIELPMDDRRMMYATIMAGMIQCDPAELSTVREVVVGFDPVIYDDEDGTIRERRKRIGEIVSRLGTATFQEVVLVYTVLRSMHRIPRSLGLFRKGHETGEAGQ